MVCGVCKSGGPYARERVLPRLTRDAQTTRGISPDEIIVDESDFVPEDLMMRTILPLLRQEFVCLIMITTEGPDSSVYRKMFSDENMYFEGGKAFNKVQITAVCKKCYELGVRTTCKHKKIATPSWITPEREKLTEHFGKHNPEAYHKESLGMSMAGGNNVFNEEYLKRWFSPVNSSYFLDIDMRTIFIGVDPQGSHRPKDTQTGDHAISHFAIVTFTRDYSRNFVMLGAENICSSNPHDYRPILVKHVQTMAATEYLRKARIVLIVEDNMANEATLIYEALNKLPELQGRLVPMSDHSARVGRMTTEETKWAQIVFLDQLLRENMIKISGNFYTQHKDGPEGMKRLIYDEFTNFKAHRAKSNVPGKIGKLTYSGKSGDGRKRDDMVASTLICLRNAEDFLTRRMWAHARH